jgi:hypothetical protein
MKDDDMEGVRMEDIRKACKVVVGKHEKTTLDTDAWRRG